MSKNYTNTDYWKIVPSYSCNKNCSYCYNKLLKQETPSDNQKQIKVLSDILKNQQVEFVSEIIGGEPLDDLNLLQTQNIIEILTEESLCKKIILTTAIYDIEKIKCIAEKIDFLYLSVDIDELSEKSIIEQDLILDIVNICKKKSVTLCISVTLSGNESIDDIQKFVLAAQSLGVTNFGFGFISFINHSESIIDKYIDLFYFLVLLRYDLDAKRVFVGGDLIDSIGLALYNQKRSKICNCGDTSFVIQPNGQISPSICYNTFLNNEPDEFLFLQKEREEKLKMNDCKSCELWDYCFGGCTGNAFVVQNNHYKCDIIFCMIIKGVWKKLNLLKKTEPLTKAICNAGFSG